MGVYSEHIAERFWQKVQRRSDDECWLWTAAKQPSGNGVFRVLGKNVTAHRMAFLLTYGEIAEGHHVYHVCTEASCANPSHLHSGTAREVGQFMAASGRIVLHPENVGKAWAGQRPTPRRHRAPIAPVQMDAMRREVQSRRSAAERRVEALFWSHITVGKPDECWEWMAARDKDGYGSSIRRNGSARAHRVAYEFAIGPIPKGMILMHSCDNPPCCNPAHLRPGSHADNIADSITKGRWPVGEAAYFHRNPTQGENNPRAKITERDVERIRIMRSEGHQLKDIAGVYGLGVTYISRVVKGKTWPMAGGPIETRNMRVGPRRVPRKSPALSQ